MRFSVSLALILLTSVIAFADTVEIGDGQVFSGNRIVGLPTPLMLEDDAVTISVDTARIMTIDLSGDKAVVVTTSNDTLFGDLDLFLLSITIETDTGETTIPFDRVVRLAFSRQTEQPRAATASVRLHDGRLFEGDVSATFPDVLTVEADGISTSTRLESICIIKLGSPATIETGNTRFEGTLTSDFPSWVEVETSFGAYRIPTTMIEDIRFDRGSESPVAESPVEESVATTAGVGIGVWQGIPTAMASLSWNQLRLELGMGIGSAVGFEAIPETSAVWYSGSARYLVPFSKAAQSIQPFVGCSVIGLTTFAPSEDEADSISAFGMDATVGFDMQLTQRGIPLTLFAAADWVNLKNDSRLVYQVGIRFDFAL